MLVEQKKGNDASIFGSEGLTGKVKSRIRREIDQLPLKRYLNRKPEIFSPAWTPEWRAKQIARHDPDIVHLHWIGGGFMRPETISQINVPIVWTLHDMWPFTGGCHVSNSCTKYQESCGACPHLASTKRTDLANSVWTRKQIAWEENTFNLIAPSRWIASCAEKSSLFSGQPITVIPNGLNTNLFRPHPSGVFREQLDVDPSEDLVCFGSSHQAQYKGYDLLHAALYQLVDRTDSIKLLSFGAKPKKNILSNIPVKHLGYLEGSSLHELYSDADVIVVPSRKESFGQMASEALASGTPVVAFDATGLQDIVEHKKTGYLAEPYDPKALAEGIMWVLEENKKSHRMSKRARRSAQREFAIENVVDHHLKLYNELV